MVYGVVTTLRSDVVARHDRPLTTHAPAEVADLLAEMTEELTRSFPAPAGIGIGVGGRVEKRSVVAESAFLGWTDVALAELVALRTGLAVSSRTTSPPSWRPRPGSAPVVDSTASWSSPSAPGSATASSSAAAGSPPSRTGGAWAAAGS